MLINTPPILDPNVSYTFSKYFELNYDSEQVFAELGYAFERKKLSLPRFDQPIPFFDGLFQHLDFVSEFTNLTTEMARREMLIAPILVPVCRHFKQKIKVEYRVDVNEQLKGSFDYFIPAPNNLVVIEAKNADIGRGFTQLGAELIALDKLTSDDVSVLYGVITTGNVWNFGRLLRSDRKILQDANIYAVPNELETLLSVLMGIIQPASSASC